MEEVRARHFRDEKPREGVGEVAVGPKAAGEFGHRAEERRETPAMKGDEASPCDRD